MAVEMSGARAAASRCGDRFGDDLGACGQVECDARRERLGSKFGRTNRHGVTAGCTRPTNARA